MSSLIRRSLQPYVEQYRRDFAGRKTVFVMMSFAEVMLLRELFRVVKDELSKSGLVAVRGDGVTYGTTVWVNAQTHMLGADAGLAIFDRVAVGGSIPTGFNPNVSVEAGFMMGLEKSVMLLKDRTIQKMPVDFDGLIYHSYDADNPESAREAVGNWAGALQIHPR